MSISGAKHHGLPLAVYYEGGTKDRFWVARAGLGMTEARAAKIGPYYKTREGAMLACLRVQGR